ncbi:MAG: MotA/TolQ/ExbB proton channel family protein [Cocleimonas sp.]
MNQDNHLNTPISYPVEQLFKSSLVLTSLLVLLPALALYWFLGDSTSLPRAFKLFFGNWISPIILWFFCASFLHLWLKKGKLKKEQQQSLSLSNKVFPLLLAETTDTDKNQLNQRIINQSQLNNIASNNLLITRLSLFLNHDDNDVDDGFGIKEKEQLKGSFALPRFMVWAIPILGFIGTVWGISNGIAHFSDAMTNTGSVTDVSAMLKENLPLVTNSLATAFDTTLLALLLSIPLMMLMLTIEKSEEAYLIDLDERWFHDIKPALEKAGITSHVTGSGVQISTGGSSGDAGTQQVAGEIKQLSTQVKALQETMEDLYETVFTSKLNDKNLGNNK